jgi:RHS repeat-associated protein
VVGRYTGFEVGTSADTDADYAVTYGFDAQGRLDSVSNGNQTFSYGYLADSNLIETMTSPVHTATYTYEDERNVKTVLDNVVNSLSTSKYTYAYDELARRTSRVQEGSAFAQDSFDAFGYNDRSEVIDSKRYEGADITDLSSPVALDAFAYEFDPIGNRIESSTGILPATTYTTNELNQYTQVSSLSPQPSHDSDGNLTEQDGWFYKWNAENRLVEAYSFAADKKLEFVYDYLGRRVEKKVTQISTATVTSEERFLYDVWNLIATYQLQTSNLTLQTSYTWGLDLSQTLQGLYAFAFDANGNVSEVLNDDTGAVAAHYEYSPFGEVVRSSGSYADVNPFRFSTKYLDTETGLYYYGYRHYDPSTGRWLSKDPLQERGGINLYAMVGNDPLGLWDLLGLQASVCDQDKPADDGRKGPDWQHKNRDERNTEIPKTHDDVTDDWRHEPRNDYHDNGDSFPENKYVHPDGREAVYDGETGELITDNDLKGTYNYVNPGDYSGGPLSWPGAAVSDVGHVVADVIPYLLGGN